MLSFQCRPTNVYVSVTTKIRSAPPKTGGRRKVGKTCANKPSFIQLIVLKNAYSGEEFRKIILLELGSNTEEI